MPSAETLIPEALSYLSGAARITGFTSLRNDCMEDKCLFCAKKTASNLILESPLIYAILDSYPVSGGHTLIIPKRHVSSFFEMSKEERSEAFEMLDLRQLELTSKDPKITGFNIGMNCGESAGQTIMHAHIHLIPRRDGDMDRPRGGVRGVIPKKMSY